MVATLGGDLGEHFKKDFQSAFHRGNGCYDSSSEQLSQLLWPFSPLFIAAMVATGARFVGTPIVRLLSVRFSSRQWLLLHRDKGTRRHYRPFSPLFIAAMVATTTVPRIAGQLLPFSPLFIAAMVATSLKTNFVCWLRCPFSPLFIAAMVATSRFSAQLRSNELFQSAFHRGNGCYTITSHVTRFMMNFQSAFHRGNGCYGRYAFDHDE